MNIIHWQTLSASDKMTALARPTQTVQDSLTEQVHAIKQAVLTDGDKALFDFAKRFDKTTLNSLQVSKDDMDNASGRVSDTLKAAIKTAYDNIARFHTAQIPTPIDIETTQGVRCEVITRPIDSVGLYIPGGSAPLFSTVLMLAIPAKIAGCRQIVLCSPAPISDETLYTAQLCGIDTVYAIGGAGAIFAMAYGTDSVVKVDKIFGPGNAYVTEAKRQVLADGVAIDMPAGPSEVLVIADKWANPAFVASDLLSQAEHGADSQVILLTDDEAFGAQVMEQIKIQLALLPRAQIARASLTHGRIIIADTLSECVAISNLYAPEHLIIQTVSPRSLLDDITHAGSVFLGAYSPESMGDYASGTNHVLPTYGFARTQSSLGLADFYKRMTVQELSQDGFLTLAPTVEAMAASEQLDAHKLAVSLRMQALQSS